MAYCLALVASVVLFSALCSANDCEEKKTFGAGHIEDIMLHETKSQTLILKLNNGVYDYCRNVDLDSSGADLTFADVDCTKNVREWDVFIDTLDYDITLSFEDALEFEALNDSAKQEYISDLDDTALTITINTEETTILLTDTFIHPTVYSYFYAPSMSTLFIFTADQNATAEDLDDFDVLNLVSISWDPNNLVGVFPADIYDFEVATILNVNEYNFVGDAPLLVTLVLDGQRWTSYDNYNMFTVRVNSVLADCEAEQWLRYNYIENIYTMRKNGNDGGENGTFYFDYAGAGYIGVDTRKWRMYGFNSHEIWYFESDGEGFDDFRIVPYEYNHKDLTSYWAVMWLAIAVAVLFCVCCCCCYCNKKKAEIQEGGMTQEQRYMTAV